MSTPTATAPHPDHGPALTGDDMPFKVHGMHLVLLGEEQEQAMALGHQDPLRFVAAVNRLLVEQDLYDLGACYDSVEAAVAAVRHRWAIRMPWCTADDPAECPLYAREGCLPDDGEYPWFVSWRDVTERTPGAFRVTTIDLEA